MRQSCLRSYGRDAKKSLLEEQKLAIISFRERGFLLHSRRNPTLCSARLSAPIAVLHTRGLHSNTKAGVGRFGAARKRPESVIITRLMKRCCLNSWAMLILALSTKSLSIATIQLKLSWSSFTDLFLHAQARYHIKLAYNFAN